jgi:hypothetical protein
LKHEPAVREEIHITFTGSNAAYFFLYEKAAFDGFIALQAFEGYPDSILVICPQAFHLNVGQGKAEEDITCFDHLEVPAMGLLYLVHMSDKARICFSLAFLDVEIPDVVHFIMGIGNISSYPVLDEFTELLFASGGTVNSIQLFE